MLRGINRQDIFEDDEDYCQLVSILKGLTDRYDEQGLRLLPFCSFYAYCLMSNHVHLLLQEREEHISEVVKRIGVTYAHYFNKKYERNGHLFQDRFRSEPVDSIEYFVVLLRYIHQNPLKAGIVEDIINYPWSSWKEYVTDDCKASFCSTKAVFSMANPLMVQSLEKTRRNEVLMSALAIGAGIRQLSRFTGVSFGVIQKLKNDH